MHAGSLASSLNDYSPNATARGKSEPTLLLVASRELTG